MNSLRAWIVLLALVSGLAGFAAGRLAAPEVQISPAGPFPGYAERMQEAFDLSPGRVRALRLLLERYDRDLEDLKIRHLGELRPELVCVVSRANISDLHQKRGKGFAFANGNPRVVGRTIADLAGMFR